MLTLLPPSPDLWERFQRGEPAPRDGVDEAVLRRWSRARALAEGAEAAPARPPAAGRLAATFALFDDAAAEVVRRGCALLLADGDGVIVRARGAELFGDPAVRAGLAEGVRWHEAERGTNAIGTALAERTAVAVVGSAHYAEAARALACYAAPLRDESGAIVGVLDISAPAADPQLGVAVRRLAWAMESLLRGRPANDDAVGVRSHAVRFGERADYSGLLVVPIRALVAPVAAARPPRANVVLLHDVWGLDAHVEASARALAARGLRVLAPDLYARRGERPVPLTAARLEPLRGLVEATGAGDAFEQLIVGAATPDQLRILGSLHLLSVNQTLERHLPVAVAAVEYLRAADEGSPIVVAGVAAGAELAQLLVERDVALTAVTLEELLRGCL